MKKVITIILLLLMVSTASYGAVSDDVYVRKDVFEIHIQGMNAKLDMLLEQMKEFREEMKGQRQDINELKKTVSVMSERIDGLNKRIDGVDKRIDGVNASLSEKINGVSTSLSGKIDGVNASLSARIDDVRNGIYLWLVAIGLFISWPKAKKFVQKWGKSTPSITLEDFERLMEEYEAKRMKTIKA